MAMEVGNLNAQSGLTRQIFEELRAVYEPDVIDDVDGETLETLRAAWRKLAFAVAKGVVEHLRDNLEIHDVRTRGNVATEISGTTAAADPAPGHTHGVELVGEQNGLELDQIPGTGRVE